MLVLCWCFLFLFFFFGGGGLIKLALQSKSILPFDFVNFFRFKRVRICSVFLIWIHLRIVVKGGWGGGDCVTWQLRHCHCQCQNWSEHRSICQMGWCDGQRQLSVTSNSCPLHLQCQFLKTCFYSSSPPKMECGCPSVGGIKNGHIRYPSYGETKTTYNITMYIHADVCIIHKETLILINNIESKNTHN